MFTAAVTTLQQKPPGEKLKQLRLIEAHVQTDEAFAGDAGDQPKADCEAAEVAEAAEARLKCFED